MSTLSRLIMLVFFSSLLNTKAYCQQNNREYKLTKSEIDYFEKLALAKSEELNGYIKGITEHPDTNRSKIARDLAIDMFISETFHVEICLRPSHQIIKRTVKDYFNRLYKLRNSSKCVVINWVKYGVVQNLQLADDGHYHGKILIKQHFIRQGLEGDKKPPIFDIDKKTIDIEVKYFKFNKKTQWYLKFGDINVSESKLLK